MVFETLVPYHHKYAIPAIVYDGHHQAAPDQWAEVHAAYIEQDTEKKGVRSRGSFSSNSHITVKAAVAALVEKMLPTTVPNIRVV